MPKRDINETALKSIKPPGPDDVTKTGKPKDKEFYWDTRTEGFGVCVKGDGSKFFIIQRKMPGTGESVRGTLGRWGEMTLTQARDKAVALIAKIREGVNPFDVARQTAEAAKPKTWETFTLAEAVAAHLAKMRDDGCSERSIEGVETELKANLADWLDTPLVRIIRPDDTTALGNCYRELAKKRKDEKGRMRGGPGVAARVFRNFRAVWNTARRSYPALLAYPTGVVNLSSGERKRSPMSWGVLPKWAEAVDVIENGVRRDLQWFMLLTGSRAASARTLRWENVRIRRGTIHFPKPKGGEDRAYTVPASRWLLDLLAKRRLANRREYRNCPWVFPTRNRAGDVVPVQVAHQDVYETTTDEAGEQQQRKAHFFTYRNERGETCNASPHRLRDTFATACKACKVDRFTTKLLMNHALPAGDVTDGYMGGDDEHTRACVERIAAFLLNKAGVKVELPQPATMKIAS